MNGLTQSNGMISAQIPIYNKSQTCLKTGKRAIDLGFKLFTLYIVILLNEEVVSNLLKNSFSILIN